ncbi:MULTISPECIES: hypothetical protein [unclassified Modicisalibacter]|uniref:DUF7673 family protein n=1 Tax=unclassified Modicisalibacter TaxID=2679913 RepID=UPI001CC916B2|nr:MULTISPECIES: hypothetical protein [unclassified Modicisalibacter]MBZ9559031.1 hypothetical protein [Modicisalibacter sp. R2A 31.J]MBZ9576857.1 hypothetical protein [Modicisalibacter sp. MOD 31.J]
MTASPQANQALKHLISAARGHSGQSHHLRRFLLGIYNGYDWPFELHRLRALDSGLAHDALVVLTEATFGSSEIHHWISNGDAVFLELWEREKADAWQGEEQL